MVRTPYCDKRGLRKGTWTPEEDRKLISYVSKYGHWNWRQLPKFADLARCGKSCRLRWMNYLRPGIKRGNFTPEEDETILKLHAKHGNRWSLIASHLPGRSDNDIKNHWHAHLKKRFQPTSSVTSRKPETSTKLQQHQYSQVEHRQQYNNESVEIVAGNIPNSSRVTTSTSSPETSLPDFFSDPTNFGNLTFDDLANFFETDTDPITVSEYFLTETEYPMYLMTFPTSQENY